ncbi:phenylalanine 4-monooxygenase [Streptomyces lavendulae]|uniref:phenylalanine 4-monooxygenase n=1 Tax=Streptomyces lavendulae TaxID=1914 RepID=UPI0033E8D860
MVTTLFAGNFLRMEGFQARTPEAGDGRLGVPDRHPGLSDLGYLRRRNQIAALAVGHRVGALCPPVDYTPAEQRTWRSVYKVLRTAQTAHACRVALDAREGAPIPADSIPQHAEVSARLRRLTGFDFTLAGGVVENRRFLASMAEGFFHAVQFVRHPAVPFFTPEPDVIHDVLGHGIHLSAPAFADLYRLVGRAAARIDNPDVLQMISDVYWFTLEHGVLTEGGRPKAYGAALLSSWGEISRLDQASIQPLTIPAMLATPYHITSYQPILFTARSLDEVTETVATFLEQLDEDSAPRYGRSPTVGGPAGSEPFPA